MIRYIRAGSLLCALAVTAALIGCSSQPEVPKNGTVRGRVTLKGQPLAGVTIVLLQPETKYSLSLKSEPDGGYEVKTYQDVGLPPGRYQISIRPRYEFDTRDEQVAAFLASVPTEDRKEKAPAKRPGEDIPVKYHNPATSGLTIEVVSGDNPPFDFDLVGKP